MWKRATIQLTAKYCLLFLGFIWIFSGGIYFWINDSLGTNYVNQVENQVEQINGTESLESREQAARVAAEVAIQKFRNILLTVNGIALCIVPFGAYLITRRTLRPLIQSQERQKQFVANASHELRTPLAILSGELELALKSTRSASYYRRTLTANKNEVERMIQLANQLLLLNRLDAQTDAQPLQIAPGETSLSETIRHICGKYQNLAAKNHLTFTLDIGTKADKALIRTDPRLTETALANVIHNAIKYSTPVHQAKPEPEQGQIYIAITKPNERLYRVSVTNQNDSLTSEDAAKVFERFYQSRSQAGHNSDDEGFGLGLAVTKSIVELYGETVTLTASHGKVTVTLDFKR